SARRRREVAPRDQDRTRLPGGDAVRADPRHQHRGLPGGRRRGFRRRRPRRDGDSGRSGPDPGKTALLLRGSGFALHPVVASPRRDPRQVGVPGRPLAAKSREASGLGDGTGGPELLRERAPVHGGVRARRCGAHEPVVVLRDHLHHPHGPVAHRGPCTRPGTGVTVFWGRTVFPGSPCHRTWSARRTNPATTSGPCTIAASLCPASGSTISSIRFGQASATWWLCSVGTTVSASPEATLVGTSNSEAMSRTR